MAYVTSPRSKCRRLGLGLAIPFHFPLLIADGNNGMLQKLAAELAQLRMDAILADGTQASRAERVPLATKKAARFQ
jgi:hypothetical protein